MVEFTPVKNLHSKFTLVKFTPVKNWSIKMDKSEIYANGIYKTVIYTNEKFTQLKNLH